MATDASFDYDDLLSGGRGGWRSRTIAAVVLALALAAVGFAVWWMFFRSTASATASVQTATVSRGNITKSVSTSGVVVAQQSTNLNFSTSGRVTKVDVTLGQQVAQGAVLAEIDPSDAQSALNSANLSLLSAQAKLTQLLQGSTASALASADQSLIQAQAAYDKAVRALQTLQDPPTATDLEAAQQSVTAAKAQLQQAQDARTKLDTDNSDAIKATQKAIDKARAGVDSAQQSETTVAASVSSAEANLNNTESAYCPDDAISFCSSRGAPLSSSDQSTLVTATNSGPPDKAKAASSVLSMNTAYTKAVADQQTATNAVTTAESALQDAQDSLVKAQAGSTPGQIASADSAISGAKSAVDAALDKLAKLQAGATQDQLDAVQSDVNTAQSSLTATNTKRNETYAGSLATDIQQQRQAVSQQQNAVDKAQKDLDNTKLVAPFRGSVAALNVQVGDLSGSGSGASSSGSSSGSSAAVVLNTPDNVVLNLTVSETDYQSVKAGQNGIVTFDSIAGRQFPVAIDAIGTNPTTTQGVVTYNARAHFVDRGAGGFGAGAPSVDTSGGAVSPPAAPGVGGGRQRGSRTPGAGGASGTTPAAGDATPPTTGTAIAADATPSSPPVGGGQRGQAAGAAASTAKPIPGMNAKITIIVDQRQNVLRVPTSAIQRDGQNRVVDVKKSDGSTEKAPVQIGLADATNTELTSGVDEGATIILPGAVASTTVVAGAAGGQGAGGGFGGGGFGGGGGGRGGGGGGGG